jgi:tetratricopeptide (TPR) repeat protein
MTLEEILSLHRAGQLERAEAAYRQLLSATGDDADALHLLGVLRQQQGDLAEASELIRRAIQLAPNEARFHLSLGGVLQRLGLDEVARDGFERALLLDPNLVEAHALVGHLALRDGDIDGAERRFRIGRRADEEDPVILFGLGSVFLARHDPVNAAKFLTRAAQRKPDDAAIQTSLGRALFEQGTFAFAERAFENALRLRPDLAIAKLYLARSRFRQDRLEAAREGFADLLAKGQQAFGANAGLGDIARKKDQPVRALKYYRQALALDPTHAGAALAAAWCMERLGDLDGAAKYLAAGLRHSPQVQELRQAFDSINARLAAAAGRGVTGAA